MKTTLEQLMAIKQRLMKGKVVEASLNQIYYLLYGWDWFKDVCPHPHTTVHYREDYAAGDLIVWKEVCDDCYSLVRGGWDEFKPRPNTYPKPAPETKFDEGYVINWDFLKGLNEGICKS